MKKSALTPEQREKMKAAIVEYHASNGRLLKDCETESILENMNEKIPDALISIRKAANENPVNAFMGLVNIILETAGGEKINFNQ